MAAVITRRQLFGLRAATPDVYPREAWAGDIPAPGALPQEQAGDVRVLLVHHSASSNDYTAADVPGIIRGFHALHTGDRGWPDVAYNFFVDRYGTVWEGRAGSLDGPVIGDATGGNQGYSQLVCLIGDHRVDPPTAEAQSGLVAIVTQLAYRYGLDTSPGATTSFVSRGSNRWPAGATVTSTTIAGHRDMSATVCPGDAAYAIVRDELPALVTAALRPPTTTTTATTTTTTTTTTAASTTTTTSTSRPEAAAPAPRRSATSRDDDPPFLLIGGAAVAIGAVAALALRLRARGAPPGR